MIVVAVTACLGTYIHDNPSGIAPIADINAGKVGVGENVTIMARMISGIQYYMGLCDATLLVTDGQGNITLGWDRCFIQIGWVIIARGTVASRSELGHVQWVERIWLFV